MSQYVMDVSPLGGSCRPMWSLCWPVLEKLHQQELSGALCSSPGGYRKHLDTAEHDMVHRQGHSIASQAVTQMWGYSGSDLEIIRRMYKLDENITTEIIILPKFYIILVIKFFTFYQIFQFTWEHLECQNIFFIKENQFQKCFSFPKIFSPVWSNCAQHQGWSRDRETNDRDERQNYFFRSISSSMSSMLSKFW